jgi:hypothetical protein
MAAVCSRLLSFCCPCYVLAWSLAVIVPESFQGFPCFFCLLSDFVRSLSFHCLVGVPLVSGPGPAMELFLGISPEFYLGCCVVQVEVSRIFRCLVFVLPLSRPGPGVEFFLSCPQFSSLSLACYLCRVSFVCLVHLFVHSMSRSGPGLESFLCCL